MEANPAFALGVATYLSDRVRFFGRHTELLAHGEIAKRVRETLRTLAERQADDGKPPALCFSQSDLAALVGASRQRVNPVLTALRRAGILELQQGVVRILTVTAL
ncbi:MAG TPA: helix-turn-helix domain-containing protein [Terriglobia bacterium]|nr:helix-turn-helix domain-containing protein [Terriglobia bacterium]